MFLLTFHCLPMVADVIIHIHSSSIMVSFSHCTNRILSQETHPADGIICRLSRLNLQVEFAGQICRLKNYKGEVQ